MVVFSQAGCGPGLKAHFDGGGSFAGLKVQLPLLKQEAPSERHARLERHARGSPRKASYGGFLIRRARVGGGQEAASEMRGCIFLGNVGGAA
jgi:hypothetical protein